MAKKIGVVLSGCGVYDGSEIHEAVITLLAIDQADEHHDKSTADLFTEISRTADKQLWFLESHVQA